MTPAAVVNVWTVVRADDPVVGAMLHRATFLAGVVVGAVGCAGAAWA